MATAGLYDVVLAVGYEKLVHPDKARTFSVFSGAVDVADRDGLRELIDRKMSAVGMKPEPETAANRSLFMDIYATEAIAHMQRYGTTREQSAAVTAKNSRHGEFVSPVFVERALVEHPALDDVFVHGVPAANAAPGEKDVVAAIVARGPSIPPFFSNGPVKARTEHGPELHPIRDQNPEDPSEKPQDIFLLKQFQQRPGSVYSTYGWQK